MNADLVRCATDGHIARIALNRFEAVNPINPPLEMALTAMMTRYRGDPKCWMASHSGTGERMFCPGR